MNWEPIIAGAQISIGIAILIVAAILASQLILQRKVLDRAHLDAAREIAFASRNTINPVLLLRLTSDSLANVVSKGFQGTEALTGHKDLIRFDGYMKQTYYAFIDKWQISGEYLDIVEFKERAGNLLSPVGGRQYYLRSGRDIVSLRSNTLTKVF